MEITEQFKQECEALGITLTGQYNGEPTAEVPEGSRELWEALKAGRDIKALATTEQLTAYKAVQKARVIEKREKEYEKTNKEVLNLIYDLLKAGKTLNATNLKPWLDSVDKVKADIPLPEDK